MGEVGKPAPPAEPLLQQLLAVAGLGALPVQQPRGLITAPPLPPQIALAAAAAGLAAILTPDTNTLPPAHGHCRPRTTHCTYHDPLQTAIALAAGAEATAGTRQEVQEEGEGGGVVSQLMHQQLPIVGRGTAIGVSTTAEV